MEAGRGSPPEDEDRPRTAARVVLIGASAGGLQALEKVIGALPPDFPAAVVVVQHLHPHHRSLMAELLGHHTSLTVRQAAPGQRLDPGTVTVSVPDHHVVVTDDDGLALTDTPQVHYVRPAADVLFDSAARHIGPRAIAVVMTGTGSDGADGVVAVHAAGGTVVVQDPETAQFDAMPRAAITTGFADHVVPLDDLARLLTDLVTHRGAA